MPILPTLRQEAARGRASSQSFSLAELFQQAHRLGLRRGFTCPRSDSRTGLSAVVGSVEGILGTVTLSAVLLGGPIGCGGPTSLTVGNDGSVEASERLDGGSDAGEGASLFGDAAGGGGLTCGCPLNHQSKSCLCACPDGGDTTLSGTVYDPAGKNPVYGADVYVAVDPLLPLSDGVTCTGCSNLYTGMPIASALTDAAGHFTMVHAPAAHNVPLVVQVGKWRKL